MVIVDAHCHALLEWYEPIETLLFEMDRNDVDQAVLIQINGQFDNSYQAEAVRRYPGRFCSVVLVDHLQPDAPNTLERLGDGGASGVRLARACARRARIRLRSGGRLNSSAWPSAAEAAALILLSQTLPPLSRRCLRPGSFWSTSVGSAGQTTTSGDHACSSWHAFRTCSSR